MNSTAKQSNDSVQSNDIRSLSDEELDLASGGMSDFMREVVGGIWNWALCQKYHCEVVG